MVKSLITAVLSALRWTHWLVKCAVVFGRTPASRTGITWVRDARGNVFPGCRSGKGAISPLLAGYQKRGETIVIYDSSARFSEEDKNENKEK
ncbi:hypothetical protein [Klebsiella pasteurii]|uniref:hypothetical protein n=1 Tax=Klebsiella pasteurii TaxID=2587529 RepID=UPI0028775705|nr:hypothetical protein [Klebsiella pasteurii]WND12990.1 hypothetical protein RIV03_28045 [Klebsiella pasteurii]